MCIQITSHNDAKSYRLHTEDFSSGLYSKYFLAGGHRWVRDAHRYLEGGHRWHGIFRNLFRRNTPHNVVEISSRGHISFVSVLEVKMNYAVLNKSDEVKDGTLSLVPGTSRRPWWRAWRSTRFARLLSSHSNGDSLGILLSCIVWRSGNNWVN